MIDGLYQLCNPTKTTFYKIIIMIKECEAHSHTHTHTQPVLYNAMPQTRRPGRLSGAQWGSPAVMSNRRSHKPAVSERLGSPGSFQRGHGESSSECQEGILDVGRDKPTWMECWAVWLGRRRCCAETMLTSEAGRAEWLIFYRDELTWATSTHNPHKYYRLSSHRWDVLSFAQMFPL